VNDAARQKAFRERRAVERNDTMVELEELRRRVAELERKRAPAKRRSRSRSNFLD
jgi:hypothetical protein